MKSKSELKRLAHQRRNQCHECQLAAGGTLPPPPNIVTMTMGDCPGCKKKNVGIMPFCDYNWPAIGVKAVWD